MENDGSSAIAKRVKLSVEDKETLAEDESTALVPVEENESRASEQVKIEIAHILEKINNFTEMVSELLESGKSMLKELSNDFEERMILIHKEQILKWQDEIKELRSLDAANEEADALLQSAKYLLQNVHGSLLGVQPSLYVEARSQHNFTEPVILLVEKHCFATVYLVYRDNSFNCRRLIYLLQVISFVFPYLRRFYGFTTV